MGWLRIGLLSLFAAGLVAGAEGPAWVERLGFWARPELVKLRRGMDGIDGRLAALPSPSAINSGNRIGYQSAGTGTEEELWVEVELETPQRLDRAVIVPMLAKGAEEYVPGFGFPKRFVLEAIGVDGARFTLMEELEADFPNPGCYPVSAACPPDTPIRSVRLTARSPWKRMGSPLLALSEIMLLKGNRNMAVGGKVNSATSREIPYTWARGNLVDMMTPLGLPIAPDPIGLLGWHGTVRAGNKETQSVTVNLGSEQAVDLVQLIPAWSPRMPLNSFYGFPAKFLIEGACSEDFHDAFVIHDQTKNALQSPGSNLQIFPAGGKVLRYIRVSATSMRNREGDYVFALGELQAYRGDRNVAGGAEVIAPESLKDGQWGAEGLTDGYACGGRLLELPVWIAQLGERRRLEEKRGELERKHSELFAATETTLVIGSAGGTCLATFLAGALAWRGRRQRIQDRERHRERLARDLHDELGSNLGSIALISSLAADENPEQMRMDLAEIERVARESADSMRDMVSLLHGKRSGDAGDWLDSMGGLAERMGRGIALECRLPAASSLMPNVETRRELFLFSKEVLHNAIRHGSPTEVEFLLDPTPGGLRLEIRDNGCGFDPSSTENGFGLGNLRERSFFMNAKLVIESSPGMGTKVILEIPRNRRWKRAR